MPIGPGPRRHTIRVPVTKAEDGAIRRAAEEMATSKAGLIRRLLFGSAYEVERFLNPRKVMEPVVIVEPEDDAEARQKDAI